MSKKDVLQQIYLREVPLILHKISERRRQEALSKLCEQQLHLSIAAATAGSCVSKESVENISNALKTQSDTLTRGVKKQQDNTKPKEDPWKQLEELQGLIAQTRQRKRR